ncbi:hypothetical protein [Mycoplasmoides alvi]|uniref:hypothetical protein n=1 Tax=Mycoplasmoides alvi TaxID=78580 RepID=UPI00051B1C18|nr:hypothetical protein [Mycoplasmoides alvi]
MKFKFNYKYLLLSFSSAAILSATSLAIVTTFSSQNQNTNLLKIKDSSQPIISKKIGQKVGKLRHWQNNNFTGIEVTNGGFVVLTEGGSATRIDAFGNILWEFNPSDLVANYSEFANKKVVEITEDKQNSNVLYLLLIPNQAPDSNQGIDGVDPLSYDNLKGTGNKKNQAVVVQITERTYSYVGSNWEPSFVINKCLSIDPQNMVKNYPSNWTSSSSSSPTFFSKEDHPSWYVTTTLDKVNPASTDSSGSNQSSSVTGESMVLPWKQYITNLGNMYAVGGNVFVFGGNGSIYNDPEALSIGVWKLNFNSDISVGIPYAYLLSGISYSPSYAGDGTSQVSKRWDQCYAPIAQTKDMNYVPRLAIGGVETNVSSTKDTFLYLAGAITVGQIKNSQTREWDPSISDQTASQQDSDSTNQQISLQKKRSLQLSGQNVISNPKNPDRNSIDPCLLFGTAFNIDSLINMPNNASIENYYEFSNILFDNQYFDIGTDMSYNASIGTYYFFDDKKKLETTSTAQGLNSVIANEVASGNTNIQTIERGNAARHTFPFDFQPTISDTTTSGSGRTAQSFPFGTVHNILEFNTSTSNSNSSRNIPTSGKSKVSYSYNLALLVDNARNYYYPTLSFGYSLKSLGSLVKVKMKGQLTENKGKTFYGYAMQVGKSILFINEPKFDPTSIVYRMPSTVSIGNNNVIGTPKYRDENYIYRYRGWGNNNSYQGLAFSSCGYSLVDNDILSLGVTEYVAGVKDFNDTVPEIAKKFVIGRDPYATESIKDATNSELLDAQLPWNDFMGLSFANDGQWVASSWADQNDQTKNKLFLTINPQLTEYPKSWLWTEHFFTRSNDTSASVGNQAWFENTTVDFEYPGQDIAKEPGQEENEQNPQNNHTNYYVHVLRFKGPIRNNSRLQNPNGGFYANLNSNGSNTTGQSQLSYVLKASNDVSNVHYFFGQSTSTSKALENGISYCSVDDNYMTYKIDPSFDRNAILGQGNFITNVSNSLLSNSLTSILETIPVSTLTKNPNDRENISVVKNNYVSEIFKTTKQPEVDKNNEPPYGSVLIVATNVNLLQQSTTFTAYSWNKVLNCYDIMPSSASTSFSSISNSLFSGFSALAEWVLPVAIIVPIAVVGLIAGLGCAIGIPMAKHRRSMKVGFKLQNEKVNALTTAVGGVFKKIIESTDGTNMKSKPQMLKSGSSSKAASPASKPGSTPPPSAAKPATPAKPTSTPAAKPATPAKPTSTPAAKPTSSAPNKPAGAPTPKPAAPSSPEKKS